MFKKTKVQEKAVKALNGDCSHVMLYGGSGSGKTFIAIRNIFIRATKCESRHVILRQTFSAAKLSLWHGTIPEVVEKCFPSLKDGIKYNSTDFFIKFDNGSEIWIGGLDDKERTEKILGREFSTIYFNECSQINYKSILIARTRLRQKTVLRNKFYYDCNPPLKTHWTYKLFILGIEPIGEEKLPEGYYDVVKMNPADNLENLGDDYMQTLEQLPEAERKRFLYGEFGEISEAIIFKNWKVCDNIEWLKGEPFLGNIHLEKIPTGMDFGFNPDPAVVIDFYLYGESTIVWHERLYEKGLTMLKTKNPLMPSVQKRLEDMGFSPEWLIIADSSRPDNIAELRGEGYNIFAVKKPGIEDSLSMLLSFDHLVTKDSENVIFEMENYRRGEDKNGDLVAYPIDKHNHAIDSARYVLHMKNRLW